MQGNFFISAMRTLVPLGVGLVLSLTGRLGIPVDSEQAALVVLVILAGAYYLLLRGLEWLADRLAWRPLRLAAGVLLGWAQPPSYGTGDLPHISPEELAALRRRTLGEGDAR
ncbi:hypothetical protein ACPCK1_02915 [Streptomyces pseudogriseolus]|uniref:hypothetical protein n=1 Tax=Streptomyces pseudogriseolus TaxID=36817 RepID=UPI003FA31C48